MAKRVGMEVAVAVAEAVGQCNIDMAAVYPITPQSHIAEHLSDLVADGKSGRGIRHGGIRTFGDERGYRRFRHRRACLIRQQALRA